MACVVEGPLKTGKDNERIKKLTDLVTAQQKVLSSAKPLGGPVEGLRSKLPIFPFDTMITPWESKFGNKPNWHFVAKSPDDRICGWLAAQTYENDDRKYIYLVEISTRRIKDDVYGGVGRQLHEALVNAARDGGYDFIYLYPINSGVAKVYEGWGYSPSYDISGVAHQFYVLNRPPTKGFVGTLLEKRDNVTLFKEARGVFGKELDKYRRDILAEQGNVEGLKELLIDFDVENAEIPDLVDRPRREKEVEEINAVEAARRENQRNRLSEFLVGLQPTGTKRKLGGGGSKTHRLRFLRKHHMTIRGYSLGELSKVSKVSRPILQQVYDRGIGAYKTNPTSVRMKGTFRKGVNAPYSKKLSKEQWAMARVYSFLDGNPKHDGDLRRKTRRRHK
jgi:hypothetical protein